MRGVRSKWCQNERTPTSEEFQVRRLKTVSYDSSVSELHAWLVDSLAPGQPGGQEERVEEYPHDAEPLKPRRGGGMRLNRWSTAEYISEHINTDSIVPH